MSTPPKITIREVKAIRRRLEAVERMSQFVHQEQRARIIALEKLLAEALEVDRMTKWRRGARRALRTATKARVCRVCGCTDGDCSQCIKKTGKPCYWVEKDLCSACVSHLSTATAERDPALAQKALDAYARAHGVKSFKIGPIHSTTPPRANVFKALLKPKKERAS